MASDLERNESTSSNTKVNQCAKKLDLGLKSQSGSSSGDIDQAAESDAGIDETAAAGQLSVIKSRKRKRRENDDNYRTRIMLENYKFSLECERLRKCQESMERHMKLQDKVIEYYHSQVSSMMVRSENEYRDFQSLFLKVQEVSNEKYELGRENIELKRKIEYLKNPKNPTTVGGS